MKYIINFCIALLGFIYTVYGQTDKDNLMGKVSFVTSKSVYVKFDDTSVINVGDTLALSKNNLACLLVTNKSTTSVVCSKINECDIQKDDEVYYTPSLEKPETEKIVTKKIVEQVIESAEEGEKKSLYSQQINGRVSLSSYSTLSNIRDDRHRLMSRFSLTADHINDSKFSFDSYLNYRKNIVNGDESNFSPDSYLRVYNLALKYDATPTLSMTIGRNINPKMSSVGAIDGLQVEKYFGSTFVGAIAGVGNNQ